jgi:hypothetical protein
MPGFHLERRGDKVVEWSRSRAAASRPRGEPRHAGRGCMGPLVLMQHKPQLGALVVVPGGSQSLHQEGETGDKGENAADLEAHHHIAGQPDHEYGNRERSKTHTATNRKQRKVVDLVHSGRTSATKVRVMQSNTGECKPTTNKLDYKNRETPQTPVTSEAAKYHHIKGQLARSSAKWRRSPCQQKARTPTCALTMISAAAKDIGGQKSGSAEPGDLKEKPPRQERDGSPHVTNHSFVSSRPFVSCSRIAPITSVIAATTIGYHRPA